MLVLYWQLLNLGEKISSIGNIISSNVTTSYILKTQKYTYNIEHYTVRGLTEIKTALKVSGGKNNLHASAL